MPHPKNPDIVYGSCKGQFGVMNLKTGQEKNYWVGAQSLYGNPAQRSDLPLPARVADGDCRRTIPTCSITARSTCTARATRA